MKPARPPGVATAKPPPPTSMSTSLPCDCWSASASSRAAWKICSRFTVQRAVCQERAAYIQYLAGHARLRRGSPEGAAIGPEQKAQALAELGRAVQLVPDYAPALTLLCEQLLVDGQVVEAARLLLAAAESRDDDMPRAQAQLRSAIARKPLGS